MIINKPLLGVVILVVLFAAVLLWMFLDIKRDSGLASALTFTGLLLSVIIIVFAAVGLMSGAL